MPIKRTLNKANQARLMTDFRFLPKVISSFRGELDLAIRDNYLNLYFRGHSAARIGFKRGGQYEIRLHRKFWEGPLEKDTRFRHAPVSSPHYITLEVGPELLHPFFQTKHLKIPTEWGSQVF